MSWYNNLKSLTREIGFYQTGRNRRFTKKFKLLTDQSYWVIMLAVVVYCSCRTDWKPAHPIIIIIHFLRIMCILSVNWLICIHKNRLICIHKNRLTPPNLIEPPPPYFLFWILWTLWHNMPTLLWLKVNNTSKG